MNGHHYHYRTIIATWTAALLPWMSSTGTDHKEPPAGLGVQPAVSLERTELSEHTIKLCPSNICPRKFPFIVNNTPKERY